MKTIEKWVRLDVKIQTSHLWIVGLGIVIALGFVINCVVAPFYEACVPIDSEQLILSASVIAGLGTARQFVLYRFKYLQNLEPQTSEVSDSRKVAEDVLREKIWVPCVGWSLVLGFVVNMLLLPFFSGSIRPVEWSFLQASIGIFLTISGTREASIYKKADEAHQKMQAKKSAREKTGDGSEIVQDYLR